MQLTNGQRFFINSTESGGNQPTLTIEYDPTNHAPVAANDNYKFNQGNSQLTVSAPGVLSNDRDVNGDALTAVLVSDASQGSVTLNADGSFVYMPNPDFSGSDTFTYSARGVLLSATIGTQTITYAYDGLGRRVTKTIGTATTQYLYGNPLSPLQLTQVRNAAGQLTTLDYDDSGLLVALERGGSRYYVSTDQLGSPRVISDATGAAVKVLDFDAFGVQTADSSPTFDLPLGFAGGLADPEAGLVHFGFRDYEPASGRWTARDPALFGGGQGNLYAYVGNAPTVLRDPTGLFCLGASFYDIVGAGASICITGKGVSVCEEVGFGFGGGIKVDPLGGLKAAGNDLVAEVGASCGPLSVSAGVTLNHCGDVSWDADASLGAGPLGVSFDKSGNGTLGLSGEHGPVSGEIDSEGNVGIKVKLHGPQGDVRPKGFNGACSIGGKVAGRFCQRFGG